MVRHANACFCDSVIESPSCAGTIRSTRYDGVYVYFKTARVAALFFQVLSQLQPRTTLL